MADTSGQTTIRGIDIDKLAKGYADEENVFKKFLTVTPTSAREIRYYQKTEGFITGPTTTGITTSGISNISHLALPVVAEQSWTRLTSYVRKYFVESPWMSYEDVRDCDPDILATNMRDLTRAVENQVDIRIYSLLSGSLYLSGGASGTGWGDTTNGNPILDMLSGSALIRAAGYDISDLVLLINPVQYKSLLNYIITVKGSSIPAFSSAKVENGVLMNIVGNRVVVSNNCTNGTPVQIVPQRVATWKTFAPITAVTKDDPGIGSKIRCWEEGECLVTDPNAGFVIKLA